MEKYEFTSSPFVNVSYVDIPGIFISLKFKQILILKNYLAYVFLGIKTVKNFLDVANELIRNKDRIHLEFRDGLQYEVSGKNLKHTIYLLLNIKSMKYDIKVEKDFQSVEFEFEGRRITLEGPDCLGLAFEIFFRKEYDRLSIRKKTVIDIGANIGDTAIYFATSGAKQVIAFEPYPYSYTLAKKNVKKNGFENIRMFNAGVGSHDGRIIIDEKIVAVGGSQLLETNTGRNVRIYSLESIVKKNLKEGKNALKMDCEGYEYDILLSAPKETVRKFDEIMVEFHYGHMNLEKKLKECGFEVKIVKRPVYFYCDGWEYPHGRVGMLYAKKRD